MKRFITFLLPVAVVVGLLAPAPSASALEPYPFNTCTNEFVQTAVDIIKASEYAATFQPDTQFMFVAYKFGQLVVTTFNSSVVADGSDVPYVYTFRGSAPTRYSITGTTVVKSTPSLNLVDFDESEFYDPPDTDSNCWAVNNLNLTYDSNWLAVHSPMSYYTFPEPEQPVDSGAATAAEIADILDTALLKFFVIQFSAMFAIYMIKRISYAPDK